MKYYIIAGERSGDLHAGNLAREIARLDSQSQMRGFGGDHMRSTGVYIAIHYNEVAVMGFWEVLTSLRKISKYLDRCKEDILSFNPDVVILVDYGGFNKRIAAWAKSAGITVFYYISPKVWAWNQSRAWKLKATVDRMFVILPFEKDFYKKFDWDVDYVGNPVLDAVKAHVPDPEFKAKNSIPDNTPVVALLPGSRRQELNFVIPVMAEVARNKPDLLFALAAIRDMPEALYNELRILPNVRFVYEDTYNLLLNSSAAIVTSGTATLETALFKVPQVVVYKTSAFSYLIASNLIRVPYISLVNLIAGKEVVRELIQNNLSAASIAEELGMILSPAGSKRLLQEYESIYQLLDIGSASSNAALLMTRYLSSANAIS